jgi:hypothetical protein
MEVGFKLDDAQVRRLVQRAPAAVLAQLRQLIEAAAIDIQREMIMQAPVGVGGGAGLRGSIRYKFSPTQLRAQVGPNVPYAAAVEQGSRPRWVSVREGSPLRRWARLKGINPYAVQRSIARKGTRPHPYVKPTYNRMKPIVERDIADGMVKLVRRLDSAGI